MDEPDSENESLEASVEELKEKVERLENQAQGKNRLTLQAYDLRVQADSEESSMQNLARICSQEMDHMMKQALVGEYQELEEQDFFSVLLGDD